jgi:hypothetical protein
MPVVHSASTGTPSTLTGSGIVRYPRARGTTDRLRWSSVADERFVTVSDSMASRRPPPTSSVAAIR